MKRMAVIVRREGAAAGRKTGSANAIVTDRRPLTRNCPVWKQTPTISMTGTNPWRTLFCTGCSISACIPRRRMWSSPLPRDRRRSSRGCGCP